MSDIHTHGNLNDKLSSIPDIGPSSETESCRLQFIESREFEVHFRAPRDVISLPLNTTRCALALDSDKVVSTEIQAHGANFHPAGTSTYSRTELGETTFIAIDFEPHVRENLEDELNLKAQSEIGMNLDSPNFHTILQDGIRFFKTGQTLGRLAIESLTLRLLFHTIGSGAPNQSERRIRKLDGPQLTRFLDVVEMCLIDDVSVTELSDTIGYTPLELLSSFYDATGQSLPHYVHERRLAHAMDILRTEDLSTDRVAQEVGMGCADTLTTAFKYRLGLSPDAFRAQSLS